MFTCESAEIMRKPPAIGLLGKRHLSRRAFVSGGVVLTGSVWMAGCASAPPPAASAPTAASAAASAAPGATAGAPATAAPTAGPPRKYGGVLRMDASEPPH